MNPDSIMATAGFNNCEVHYLKQGLAKVIQESRQHVTTLLNTPANSLDNPEQQIIEYYNKRIAHCDKLLVRLDKMQEEIERKKTFEPAHPTA